MSVVIKGMQMPKGAKMEKLKPCPFCGGEAKLQEQIIAKGAWSVVCLNEKCGAHIFFYGAEWNKETNARRWNRRAKDATD